MTRPPTFRYCRDRLFLTCCSAYLLNRFALAPTLHLPFLLNYFDDLLLIPCALPPLLWIHRQLNWRTDDTPPTLAEIGLHWLVWALVCEEIAPKILHHGTGDPWDIVAYGFGAACAWLWWNRDRVRHRLRTHFARGGLNSV